MTAAEYTTVIFNTHGDQHPSGETRVWHCIHFNGMESVLSQASLRAKIFKGSPLLMKTFLRQVFKVLHSLVQTEASSFHSHCSLKTPYELSQTGLFSIPGSAFAFLHDHSNSCFSSSRMPSFPPPSRYIHILLLIRAPA